MVATDDPPAGRRRRAWEVLLDDAAEDDDEDPPRAAQGGPVAPAPRGQVTVAGVELPADPGVQRAAWDALMGAGELPAEMTSAVVRFGKPMCRAALRAALRIG